MDGAKRSASPPAARADGHANDQSLMNSRRLMRAPLIPGIAPGRCRKCRVCITAILAANVSVGSFSSDRPAPDALGMSASLRSRPNLRTAAIRRGLYSITSLAPADSPSGTSRPSVLAVLRLMMSSIFVTCCTGRSAGFSPLRIRPV
jgi:hypothetical protein